MFHDISELYKINGSPDLEALKLWKGRSGEERLVTDFEARKQWKGRSGCREMKNSDLSDRKNYLRCRLFIELLSR